MLYACRVAQKLFPRSCTFWLSMYNNRIVSLFDQGHGLREQMDRHAGERRAQAADRRGRLVAGMPKSCGARFRLVGIKMKQQQAYGRCVGRSHGKDLRWLESLNLRLMSVILLNGGVLLRLISLVKFDGCTQISSSFQIQLVRASPGVKVTKNHCYWCYSIHHIWFCISLPL